MIRLVRDVLDNQLVARDGVRIGKVDEIVIAAADDEPLEVVAIEIGGVSAARRLDAPFRQIATWVARRWGVCREAPYRIPWDAVQDVGLDIDVDVDSEGTPANTWKRRVMAVLELIPGA